MEVITDFKITCGRDIGEAIYRVDKEFYVPVKRFKDDHVFDEDKSVKWNREEVERKNSEFENAVKQLNREKNLLYTELISMINSYITVETGVSVKKSEKIWNYLYSNYHAYGLAECLNHLDELLELFL